MTISNFYYGLCVWWLSRPCCSGQVFTWRDKQNRKTKNENKNERLEFNLKYSSRCYKCNQKKTTTTTTLTTACLVLDINNKPARSSYTKRWFKAVKDTTSNIARPVNAAPPQTSQAARWFQNVQPPDQTRLDRPDILAHRGRQQQQPRMAAAPHVITNKHVVVCLFHHHRRRRRGDCAEARNSIIYDDNDVCENLMKPFKIARVS